MFLKGLFPKSLEISEKSLWSKQSKNCQDMGWEFYELTRKLFLQMGAEFVDLNMISHTVSKKTAMKEQSGDNLLRETGSSSS